MALEEALADFLAFPVTQTGFPAIFRMEMEDTVAGILKAERTTICLAISLDQCFTAAAGKIPRAGGRI